MKKRVLMVAFEFPPSNGASVQRVMSVYNAFIEDGWVVDVITAKECAYSNVQEISPDLLSSETTVFRVGSLDASKDLSIKGKYIGGLCLPDSRGLTWIPSAIISTNNHFKKTPPDLVWSSSPIPSSHYIANHIAKKHGAKWIADIRDPSSYLINRESIAPLFSIKAIDDLVKKNSDAVFFATEGIKQLYLDGTEFDEKCLVMENGFVKKENSLMQKESTNSFRDGYFSFFYAGELYDDGRDPAPIFLALSEIIKEMPGIKVEVVFRGAGEGVKFKSLIRELNLENNIMFKPGVSFEASIKAMVEADSLILIQDALFNNQIPGKVYEYLATGKPILVKSPENSQTSEVSSRHEGVYNCYSKDSIKKSLNDIIESGIKSYPNRNMEQHDRSKHAKKVIVVANT